MVHQRNQAKYCISFKHLASRRGDREGIGRGQQKAISQPGHNRAVPCSAFADARTANRVLKSWHEAQVLAGFLEGSMFGSWKQRERERESARARTRERERARERERETESVRERVCVTLPSSHPRATGSATFLSPVGGINHIGVDDPHGRPQSEDDQLRQSGIVVHVPLPPPP